MKWARRGLNESSFGAYYLLAGYVKVKGDLVALSLFPYIFSSQNAACCCSSAERWARPREEG